MTKKLITLFIISLLFASIGYTQAINTYLQKTVFNAFITTNGTLTATWSGTTTYSGTTNTSYPGFCIASSAVDVNSPNYKNYFLYGINFINSAAANTTVFYDASTYTDATLNNQIIAKVVYDGSSTYWSYNPRDYYLGLSNSTTGSYPLMAPGNTGARFWTGYDAVPFVLNKGLTVITTGLTAITFEVIYRKY